MDVSKAEASVIERYGRVLVHMRQQKDDKRFGLVLGAGAVRDIGFPSWSELVKRIAEHPELDAKHLLDKTDDETSKSQLLFQHYRAKQGLPGDDSSYNRHEMKVRAGWQRIVHECLYRDVPADLEKVKELDNYLEQFVPVIRDTRLTINYNFDDTLERMLAAARQPSEQEKTRGFLPIWTPHLQLLPRDAVIYHPNGFLPRDFKRDKASENLVFLEDAFADQLIESASGHYSSLMYHLAQTTRLFIGLSLKDATLKHLLRQNSLMYPGHYHYYVVRVTDDHAETKHRRAIEDANFEVYNLVTLFLTVPEIAALGRLLSLPDVQFRRLMEEHGQRVVYKFMVTGSVSVGKSTAVGQFGSLRMHDEWLEQRPPGMEKDPKLLKPEEELAINKFVARQLELKNIQMLESKSGIHLIDRAPLDAFAFEKPEKWVKKATAIRESIRGNKAERTLCPAHIILMVGDPRVMAVRSISRHKEMDAQFLEDQQRVLELVYTAHPHGVSVVMTEDKSIVQVAKEVARIIFKGEYAEADMDGVLAEIIGGKLVGPSH